jgi:hypothetical protein
METKSNKKTGISFPRDGSLEAYKIWIHGLIDRFTSDELEITLTEEEWITSWKEYWREISEES